MNESSTIKKGLPGAADEVATMIAAPARDVLTEIQREGAQRLLAQAIDAEVAEWIERHAEVVDEAGCRQGVRNGHHPPHGRDVRQ